MISLHPMSEMDLAWVCNAPIAVCDPQSMSLPEDYTLQ
jgi:hypothetical protein